MSRHIFVVTRLDRRSNETPQVSIAGSYLDKEQAYEQALLLELQQMIENSSNWPMHEIQRQRDKILKRWHSLATDTASSNQSKFHHLFPPFDIINVSHCVHDCVPLPLKETTEYTSISTTNTNTNFVETPLLHKLMTTLQSLLNDEEDLANSDGEDDDDEEDEEEDYDEDEADTAGMDVEEEDNDENSCYGDIVDNKDDDDVDDGEHDDDDNEDEDDDDEDEMDGSDHYNEQADPAEDKNVIEILESEDEMQALENSNNNGPIQQRNLGNNDQDTIATAAITKPLDEMRDDENINSDYTDDDHVGDRSGDVTLLSPPHSDQKQALSEGSMDDNVGDDDDDDDDDDDQDDEIDELNDDEDDAPSKRRKIDL